MLVLVVLILVSPTEQSIERPPLAKQLINRIYNGRDPLTSVRTQTNLEDSKRPFHWESNLPVGVIDLVMELLDRHTSVTFWIEVGTLKGDSAVLAASQLKRRHHHNVTLLCMDTFLGELEYLWRFSPELLPHRSDSWENTTTDDGIPFLLRRFVENVHLNGHNDVIVPVLTPSIGGLRTLQRLHRLGELQDLPQVIYLDSSHEFDETLLEIELAWSLLAPGGILFGDDFYYPDRDTRGIDHIDHSRSKWQATTVQRALLMWAVLRKEELADPIHEPIINFRHEDGYLLKCIRVRYGVILMEPSQQWIVKKRSGVQKNIDLNFGLFSGPRDIFWNEAVPQPAWDCFAGSYAQWRDCCNPNVSDDILETCFDRHFTYNKCC